MAFADPSSIVAQFGLKPGDKVADFGSGSGFYAFAVARVVESGGRVYAIEIQKDILDRIKNTASRDGFHNVEVVWGDVEKSGGTHLRDSSLDCVIISNVLFQAEDRDGLVAEAKRVLKPGGRTLLVEWSDSSDISGPDSRHLVSETVARALFEKHGLLFDKSIQAGSHHYGFISVKQ